MSTTIRLDAGAVRALIQDNPEFRLELQRAVIVEITRSLYTNDVKDDVVKLIRECFKEHHDDLVKAVKEDGAFRKAFDARLSGLIQSVRAGTFGYADQKKLAPELVTLLKQKTSDLIDEQVKKTVGTIPDMVEKAKKDIQDTVIARVGKLSGWVEQNTKAEMLRQVREDVSNLIAKTLG